MKYSVDSFARAKCFEQCESIIMSWRSNDECASSKYQLIESIQMTTHTEARAEAMKKRGENFIKSQFKHKHTVCSASTNTNSVRLFILAYSQFPYVVWLWSHHQHQYINISTFLVVMGCFPLFSAGNTARFTSKHTFCVKWLSSITMLSECSIYWRMNQLVFFVAKLPIRKWLLFKHQTVC